MGSDSRRFCIKGRKSFDGSNPRIKRRNYVEYLCVTDCEKDSIILQEGETVDYKWIDRNSLLKMSEDEMASERAMELIEEHVI